jgi:PGF-CTERM protein
VSVTTNASTLVEGTTLGVTVDVTNDGDASGTKEIEFGADREPIENRSITLDPGENRTLQFSHRFVEPGNSSIEIDTSIRRNVTVVPAEPNLTVGTVTVASGTVRPDETVRIHAVVENTGHAPGTQRLELSLFGEVVDVRDVTVRPGERERVTFERQIAAPGNYTASVAGQALDVRVVPAEATATVSRETTTTDSSAPGFGPLAALLAVLASALALARRRR